MKKKDKSKLTHKEQRQQKQMFVVFGMILLLVIGIAILPNITHGPKQRLIANPPKEELVARNYTEEQMGAFWTNHLKSVSDQMSTGTFFIPELCKRFSDLRMMIAQRYGKPVEFKLMYGYHVVHPYILAMNEVNDGKPEVSISLEAYCNIYDSLKEHGDRYCDERIQDTFIVSLLHEMDHLAYGYTTTTDKNLTVAEGNDIERKTWPYTVEHVLIPLINNNRRLLQSDYFYYVGWTKSGKNVDSDVWKGVIEKLYSPTRSADVWSNVDIRK